MSDHSESFRTELALKLADSMTSEQIQEILDSVDKTLIDYNIEKRSVSLSVISGIPMVVKYFLGAKMVQNLSQASIERYHYCLIAFFSVVRKPVEEITTMDIHTYLLYCKTRGNSDSTRDGVRRVLNSFFSWLVKNEYLNRNPVEKVPPIKFQQHKREPLKDTELELIRWYCQDIREKALVDFFFSTGCRVSECSDAKLSDIDWYTRAVNIRHGKGDKQRIVFFNAESEVSLKKYLETRNDNSGYLFVNERAPHGQMSPRAIQVIFRKLKERCGIEKKCSPHILRHTFATHGLKSGVPLPQLQALMGHSKPETTLIYAKLDTDDLRETHQRNY